MRTCLVALLLCASIKIGAAEEKIRGVLEKTTKGGACAQITDALNDVYYVSKSDESEKAVADFVGKNIRVLITGTVEQKEGDTAFFFNLKSVQKYEPKMPEAKAEEKKPDAAPAKAEPAAAEKK
jgi:hypothetical protein